MCELKKNEVCTIFFVELRHIKVTYTFFVHLPPLALPDAYHKEVASRV